MDAIAGGFESDLNAQDVLSELSSATQSIQNDSVGSHQIYEGDLVIAMDILTKISQYDTEKVSSGDAFENFAQVASNLLDTANINTWKELKKVSMAYITFGTCIYWFGGSIISTIQSELC